MILNEVKRREFPKYKKTNWIQWIFQFIFWIILWAFFIFLFLLIAFSKLLSNNIIFFVNLFSKKHFHLDLWISVIISFFFFPFALVFILFVEILKAIRRYSEK